MDEHVMARGVGWVSLVAGLMLLAAPRRLGSIIGVIENRRVLRVMGLRDLIVGIGLLLAATSTPWLWARTLFDASDALTIFRRVRASDNARKRGIAGIAVALSSCLFCAALARRAP